MVILDKVTIGDTIPLVFLLGYTVPGLIDLALESSKQEEENLLLS